MSEEGTLSILKCGDTYRVRYASNNPSAIERQPYHCESEGQTVALLRDLQVDPWYVTQVSADLRQRGFANLPIALEEAQIRATFHPLLSTPEVRNQYEVPRQVYAA